jgi:excisionase family DNA binding protein
MTQATPATLTVEEAARKLGISRGLAFRLARNGRLPAWRLGRRLLICRPALEAILKDPARAAQIASGRKTRVAA